MKRFGLLLLLPFLFACEQTALQEYRAGESSLSLDIGFYRSVSKKTGKRLGKAEYFSPGEKSRVHGIVDFSGLEEGRTHSIHLVWLRPDEHEMFRRYAEVIIENDGDSRRHVIHWKKAEDLNSFKEEIQGGDQLSLQSKLNIAAEKEREIGRYTFRIYFNRELMAEKNFQLLESAIELSDGSENPDANFSMKKKSSLSARAFAGGLLPGETYRAELQWRKPGGKKLYSKEYEVLADEDGVVMVEGSLNTSLKKKRKPGDYSLRFVLEGSRLTEKEFTLIR